MTKLRGECIKEVKKLHVVFSFEKAMDWQSDDEIPAPYPSDTDIEKDSSPPPMTDFDRTKRRAESVNKCEHITLPSNIWTVTARIIIHRKL